MDLTILFELVAKYGWWSIAMVAGIGIIYILTKIVTSKISHGVQDGMTIVGNKLAQSITSQLQELSVSTTSQVEMLSGNITKQNNELVKTISGQNERLLSYLMHKDAAEEDIHDAKVEKRMDIAENIIDKLKDIMNKTHAVRAFIIEFHNSSKNLAGSPFAKYTCTFEWFDKGLEQICTKIAGLPYSTMAKIVGDIKRTGKHQILYTDMENMEIENPQLFSLLKDKRTTAVFYNTLYDDNNKMMGMLVIEWHTPLFTEKLWVDADMPNIIGQDAIQLSMLINLQSSIFDIEEINN